MNRVILLLLILFELLIQCTESRPGLLKSSYGRFASPHSTAVLSPVIHLVFLYICRLKSIKSNFNIEN